MAARENVHYYDKRHSNVHGQELCSKVEALKCRASTN